MADADFDELMTECAAYVEVKREELRKSLPDLLLVEERYAGYIEMIEKSPWALFGFSPVFPDGGHGSLFPADEKECAEAVAAILKKRLARISTAITVVAGMGR